jgi:hypothetical protein
MSSPAPIPRICWPYLIITSGSAANATLNLAVPGLIGSPYTTSALIGGGGYTSPDLSSGGLGPAVAVAIQAVIRAANVLNMSVTCTFSMSASGYATFTLNGVAGSAPTFTWSDTPTAALLALLGFAGTETWSPPFLSGISSISASQQVQNYWYPGLPVRADPKERSTYPRAVVETSAGVVALDLAPTLTRRTVSFENLLGWKTLIVDETSSTAHQVLERLFVAGSGGYAQFQWCDDATQPSSYKTYALREKTAQRFRAERMYDTVELYKVELEMTATTL